MKVFVTVGTTPFKSLIEYIDKNINNNLDIILQIAETDYKPKNFKYFKYKDNIDDYIDESDLIITHAGAGTIYELLEKRKKMIVIPNLDRKDKHQLELANYLKEQNYAKVCYNIMNLNGILEKYMNFDPKFRIYKKDDFFLVGRLTKEIQKVYGI